MPPRLLFSGYYGFANAGDEAVLGAAVAQIRNRQANIEIAALSNNPAATRRMHRIEAYHRYSPLSVLSAVRGCTLLASGGGSLLQDRTSARSLSYYLFMLKLARWLKKPAMIFAQGIGPLETENGRRRVAEELRAVQAITVRDVESLELLRGMGLGTGTGPEVEVTADMAFALKPEITPRVSELARERPVLALALRPWPGVDQLLAHLDKALGQLEGEVRLQAWCLQPDQDLPIAEKLAARLSTLQIVRDELQPGEWAALAGWTDLVLGMRLHALIFALSRGNPVLGVSYDPKVDSLLARARSKPLGDVGSVNSEQVVKAVRAALAEAEVRRQDRLGRAEHLTALSLRNIEVLLELVARAA